MSNFSLIAFLFSAAKLALMTCELELLTMPLLSSMSSNYVWLPLAPAIWVLARSELFLFNGWPLESSSNSSMLWDILLCWARPVADTGSYLLRLGSTNSYRLRPLLSRLVSSLKVAVELFLIVKLPSSLLVRLLRPPCSPSSMLTDVGCTFALSMLATLSYVCDSFLTSG